jgi:hypothetical protein
MPVSVAAMRTPRRRDMMKNLNAAAEKSSINKASKQRRPVPHPDTATADPPTAPATSSR